MAEQPQPETNTAKDKGAPVVDALKLRARVPQLVRDHHAEVYRYAYRLCGAAADAEDLTQQTFLLAHERIHQLREPEKALAWLLAVLRSCYLKSLRGARPAGAAIDMNEVPAPADDESPVDREKLQQALAELPPDFRLVVLMFYFEELSYKEIASELEVPVGTVMSRLSRAKSLLREKLDERKTNTQPATARLYKALP